jgi:hypothetical protein
MMATAAQQVLSLPEILGIIFQFAYDSDYMEKRRWPKEVVPPLDQTVDRNCLENLHDLLTSPGGIPFNQIRIRWRDNVTPSENWVRYIRTTGVSLFDAKAGHLRYVTDRYTYGRDGMLLRFALVCRTWLSEAMRVLWRDLAREGPEPILHQIFNRIDPQRRPMYANYVCTARLTTLRLDEKEDAAKVLSTFVFSKLTTVHLQAPTVAQFESRKYPLIHAPSVRKLFVHESSMVKLQYKLPIQEVMDLIHPIIPVSASV